jgi:hypothetical protein
MGGEAVMDTFAFSFTSTALIRIPGAVHGLRTADVGLILYEVLPGSRRRSFVPGSVEVDDLTLDVEITLAQATSGRGVLWG